MAAKIMLFHILLLLPLTLAIPSLDIIARRASKASPSSTPNDDQGDSKSTGVGSSSKDTSGGGASAIDFSKWSLQLPVGEPGNPTTIPGSELKAGSFKKPANFDDYFTMEDGVIKMIVKGSPASTGCVHTKDSKHCRTEFREVSPQSWEPTADTNRLSATLQVMKADDGSHGTCIGQIHIQDNVSVRPVAELYYNAKGELSFGVEQTRDGGNEKASPAGKIPLGTKFSYMIAFEKGELTVTINGGEKQVFDAKGLDNPLSYFKAGNYNQGNSPSEVHFFSIRTEH